MGDANIRHRGKGKAWSWAISTPLRLGGGTRGIFFVNLLVCLELGLNEIDGVLTLTQLLRDPDQVSNASCRRFIQSPIRVSMAERTSLWALIQISAFLRKADVKTAPGIMP